MTANRDVPGYMAWRRMRQRCLNPKATDYNRYGGRGITICDRWRRFDYFLEDMGPRPSPQHSLDRIDGDGNYEPGNCRWATWEEQQNNKKIGVLQIEFNGRTMTLSEAIRTSGCQMKPDTIYARVRRGWPLLQALKKPARRNVRWQTTL